MLNYLYCAVTGYLLGSLSFGIIVSRLLFGKDVRNYGSNNAGMTNTLRTFGAGPAALVFAGDILKAVVAVALSMYVLSGAQDVIACGYVGGVFAVIGHMFPLYFKFKGGKGAATALGVTLTLSPIAVPILAIPFFVTLLISKMVSLASMVTGVCLPVVTFFIFKYMGTIDAARFNADPLIPTIATSVIALLVIIMHRSNIKRIIHGEERKIGKKKKEKTDITEKENKE